MKKKKRKTEATAMEVFDELNYKIGKLVTAFQREHKCEDKTQEEHTVFLCGCLNTFRYHLVTIVRAISNNCLTEAEVGTLDRILIEAVRETLLGKEPFPKHSLN